MMRIEWKKRVGYAAGVLFSWFVMHVLDHFGLFDRFINATWNATIEWKSNPLFIARYSLFDLILFVVLLSISFTIYRWIYSKYFTPNNRRMKIIKEIQEFNSRRFSKNKLVLKWSVAFDISDNPTAHNIKPYCASHKLPLLMNYKRSYDRFECPKCNNIVINNDYSTSNSESYYPELVAVVQAELEARWDDLKNEYGLSKKVS